MLTEKEARTRIKRWPGKIREKTFVDLSGLRCNVVTFVGRDQDGKETDLDSFMYSSDKQLNDFEDHKQQLRNNP